MSKRKPKHDQPYPCAIHGTARCPCHDRKPAPAAAGTPPQDADQLIKAILNEICQGEDIAPGFKARIEMRINEYAASRASGTAPQAPESHCPTCGSTCRDAREALSTDSKNIDLCHDYWHARSSVTAPDEISRAKEILGGTPSQTLIEVAQEVADACREQRAIAERAASGTEGSEALGTIRYSSSEGQSIPEDEWKRRVALAASRSGEKGGKKA